MGGLQDLFSFEEEFKKIGDWLSEKAASLLLALIFLYIGIKIVKIAMKWIDRGFSKSKIDPTVKSFLQSIIRILLYILVFITTASIMGIQVTSFVTLLGTAGLTLGLALQGSLSNFAGGVLILILKPFVIGDYIKEDTHGNEGMVVSIDIFYTRLRTFDGKIIVVPNGVLSNASLTNFTKQEKRRIDLTIPIAYHSDLKKTREIVKQILLKDKQVLQDEPMDIVLDGFSDSALDLVIHVWVPTAQYWKTKWSILENVKEQFEQQGIEIPYQQVDVRMKDEK